MPCPAATPLESNQEGPCTSSLALGDWHLYSKAPASRLCDDLELKNGLLRLHLV